MDRRIKELEHAITANDAYLQRVESLNADLLTALQAIAGMKTDESTNHAQLSALTIAIAKTAIAKAEGNTAFAEDDDSFDDKSWDDAEPSEYTEDEDGYCIDEFNNRE
jgi:hypothetical protein